METVFQELSHGLTPYGVLFLAGMAAIFIVANWGVYKLIKEGGSWGRFFAAVIILLQVVVFGYFYCKHYHCF